MKTDVIVFNNHGVGQYVQIERLPRTGETINGRDWHIERDGGKGSNVAIALGRLGLQTAFVGLIGTDAWGNLGVEWMNEAGVDLSCLRQSGEVTTNTGLIMVDPEGNNSIVIGESSSNKMTLSEVEDCIEKLQPASYFVTGFEVDATLALAAARKAKKLGMTTLLNPSPLPEIDIGDLSYIDYLVLNEGESQGLAGAGDESDEKVLSRKVYEKLNPGCVILTLGAGGCASYNGREYCVFPAQRQEVVDTTGAGDGFLAAFTANLAWGRDLQTACCWANAYAAYTVTRLGTIDTFPDLEAAKQLIIQQ